MGVHALLTTIAPVRETVKIWHKCKGANIGIDAFGWLHQLAINRYEELVVHQPRNCDGVVKDFLEMARQYMVNGVLPIFVFDGRRLPGKSETDEQRAVRRLHASELVNDVLAGLSDEERQAVEDGTSTIPLEPKTIKAAVNVDDQLVTAVITELRRSGFGYFKAPYEADHMLACLDRLDMVQYVETVDSDLIAHGVRRVLTKVNHETGGAHLFEAVKLQTPVGGHEDATKDNPLLQLTRRWGVTALHYYAALAGCDYCQLKGYGKKRALQILAGLPAATTANSISATKVYTVALRLSKQEGQNFPSPPLPKAGFIAAIERAIELFKDEIIYHPVLKVDMPLSAITGATENYHAQPNPDADYCGVPATGMVTVTTVHHRHDRDGSRMTTPQSDEEDDHADPGPTEDEHEMSRAEAHALGFLETRAGGETFVVLPDVVRVLRQGANRPQWLTSDMVKGAELDPRLISAAAIRRGPGGRGAVGKVQLQLFLATRSVTGLSGDTWAELAQKAQDQLRTEALADKLAADRGEEQPLKYLRDPLGGCVMQYLLHRGHVTAEDQFPQGDATLTAPPITDPGWIMDMAQLQTCAPVISREVLMEHFSALGATEEWGEKGTIRAIARGYQHVESLRSLQYYACHLTPIPSRPNVVCVRMKLRASFRACSYTTCCWLEIDPGSSWTVKPVKRVLKAQCGPAEVGGECCRASGCSHKIGYDNCTHISATLQVLFNLQRPPEVQMDHALVPCTAKLCSWNKPSEGSCFDIKVPIWTHMFSKPDSERNQGHRRPVACLKTTNTRATLPLHYPGAAALDYSYNMGERPANRQEFWEVLREDFAVEEANPKGRLNPARTGRWKRFQNKSADGDSNGNDDDDDDSI
jgi:5'-3' exonuclease